jgi:aspartyl-tRNA(Asn)/glutamyl-tRNA(Gln) amidotransferase subunit B
MFIRLNGVGTSGKIILRHMLDNRSSAMPSQIARDMQFIAFTSASSPSFSPSPPFASGPSELEKLCADAIASMPDEAAAARKGNKNVINKVIGSVMQRSRGRADARSARDILARLLSEQ